jgi:hypothetical protein
VISEVSAPWWETTYQLWLLGVALLNTLGHPASDLRPDRHLLAAEELADRSCGCDVAGLW